MLSSVMKCGSPQVKVMEDLGQRIRKAENIILISFIFGMIVVVFLGVIVRYTPITGQTIWTAELARLFLLWSAFWAAGSVERFGGHFRLDMFEGLFSGKPQLFLQLFTKLVVVISMGMIIWGAITYIEDGIGMITYHLRWPQMVKRIPLLGGTLLLFTYMLTNFIRIFRRLFQ